MEILDKDAAAQAGSTVPAANTDGEPTTIIRFQKGVDFETFDDFRDLFLSILKSTKLAEGERQIEKLVESDTPSQLRSLPNFGALETSVPDSVLDFGKLRTRIRESKVVIEQMGESRLAPEMLTTTMLQVGWPEKRSSIWERPSVSV